jgi:hypothetical protein
MHDAGVATTAATTGVDTPTTDPTAIDPIQSKRQWACTRLERSTGWSDCGQTHKSRPAVCLGVGLGLAVSVSSFPHRESTPHHHRCLLPAPPARPSRRSDDSDCRDLPTIRDFEFLPASACDAFGLAGNPRAHTDGPISPSSTHTQEGRGWITRGLRAFDRAFGCPRRRRRLL